MNSEQSFIIAVKCSRLARKTLLTRGCLDLQESLKIICTDFMPILWLMILKMRFLCHDFITSTVLFYWVNCVQLFANERKHIHNIWVWSFGIKNTNLNPLKGLEDLGWDGGVLWFVGFFSLLMSTKTEVGKIPLTRQRSATQASKI